MQKHGDVKKSFSSSWKHDRDVMAQLIEDFLYTDKEFDPYPIVLW